MKVRDHDAVLLELEGFVATLSAPELSDYITRKHLSEATATCAQLKTNIDTAKQWVADDKAPKQVVRNFASGLKAYTTKVNEMMKSLKGAISEAQEDDKKGRKPPDVD